MAKSGRLLGMARLHETYLPRRPIVRHRQVKKVDHYCLSVDAMTQTMSVREV